MCFHRDVLKIMFRKNRSYVSYSEYLRLFFGGRTPQLAKKKFFFFYAGREIFFIAFLLRSLNIPLFPKP